MRHGTKVGYGYATGDKVRVTSKRLHLDGMPGVVTGDAPGYLRVRITIGGANITASIWARPREMKKARRRS